MSAQLVHAWEPNQVTLESPIRSGWAPNLLMHECSISTCMSTRRVHLPSVPWVLPSATLDTAGRVWHPGVPAQPAWEVAMNCPVQVAAVSEAEMLSQNARPSEDPTVPQHRQSGEMLEETYNQEDGREDVYERGCSIPKGCTPGSLQPIDDIHQGKETLNVAMGDLHQQSDTGKPEGWKTPSEAHEGVADRRNCCVHNPNLLHCPLDQWDDWGKSSVTCGANKRS